MSLALSLCLQVLRPRRGLGQASPSLEAPRLQALDSFSLPLDLDPGSVGLATIPNPLLGVGINRYWITALTLCSCKSTTRGQRVRQSYPFYGHEDMATLLEVDVWSSTFDNAL